MTPIINTKKLQILSGSHHPELAEKVADELGVKISPVQLKRFANSEVRCQIEESVRGADVFIFQSHTAPVDQAIMEQAIIIDAAKRASAKHITAVCPILGYARQDRKASGREPIASKLVIDILAKAGADRIVTVDLHSGQIQGFFDGPFDHLIAFPVLVDYVQKQFGNDAIIVAPDAGGAKLAGRYADRMGVDLAIIDKRRPKMNEAEAYAIIGEVQGRNCIIVDDIIDSAGTICAAAAALKNAGAKSVMVSATHGLFSPPAAKRLQESVIERIVVTDTVPLTVKLANPKIEVVSVVKLIASAVKAIFEENSVSAIFEGKNQI